MSFIVKGFAMPETCGECPMLHNVIYYEPTGEMYCALLGPEKATAYCYTWDPEDSDCIDDSAYPKFPDCPLEPYSDDGNAKRKDKQ